MVDMGENKEQRQVPHVNIQEREKHKNGLSDLEIARNFWCEIVFYLLGAMFCKRSEKHNKCVRNFFSHFRLVTIEYALRL